ncbi:MAG: hypothetical protein LBE17_13790 [Treponema sp.]|nr:hypothetical protein [Treponema sp.]
MTLSNKVLISLVAAIVLFAVFSGLAYGFFDPTADGFYNPSLIRMVRREIGQDTMTLQDFLWELQNRFSATLREPAVRRSFLPNHSADDILERSRLYGRLVETHRGLRGVRFIDTGGGGIHYSTYSQDILRQSGGRVSYRNYPGGAEGLPFETLAVPRGGESRIIPDEKGGGLIFSLPFYDASDGYRGTALFSLSIDAVSEHLASEGRIAAGEKAAVLRAPAGIILGLPDTGTQGILTAVASLWRLQLLHLTPLNPAEAGTGPALISSRTAQGMYVGRLVEGAFVFFPRAVRIILLISFFCTAYLTVFLIVNFRQDTMTIVRARIKNLQAALIEEYRNRKGTGDWNRWGRELEQRREAVRMEIKRGIKGRRGKRREAEIDACIDEAWTGLAAIIGSGTEAPPASVFTEARVEEIVKRVLRTKGAEPVLSRTDPFGGDKLPENPPRPDTVTWTQVTQEKRPGASGRRILTFTRNSAGMKDTKDTGVKEMKDTKEVKDTRETEKLTSGKERNVATAEDTSKTGPVENEEIPEELEELEEIEELEGIEEPGGPAEAAGSEARETPHPREDIDAVAREIEFAPLPENETGASGENPLSDLEIVSPFVTMLSDLESDAGRHGISGAGGDEASAGPPAKPAKLEILDENYRMSLVYRPFTQKNVPPEDLSPAEPVIKSRNGVNYINAAAFKDEEIILDSNFQRLVDSVLK